MITRMNQGRLLFICIPVLLFFNPLLITLFLDTGISQPDTFVYIAEARNIQEHFIFNTGPWGHVDTVIIVPPLYPALIALLTFLDLDPLDAALLVSQLTGLFFSVIAFLYVRFFTSVLVALVSVLSIQLSYVYFNYFSMALTEALFTCLTLGSLYFLKQIISNEHAGKFQYLSLGILSGLVFLTRELGISVIIFISAYMLVTDLARKGVSIRKYVLLFAGFAVLVVPYYSLRYIQTGQEPLSTSYRAGNYSVNVSDQTVLDEIELIKQEKSEEYHDAYRKRRALMKLLPDGSEMLRNIIVEKNDNRVEESSGFLDSLRIFKLLANPVRYINNVGDKLGLLATSLGTGLFLLFIMLIVIMVFDRYGRSKHIRLIIPGYIVVYLLVVSMFDTEISRYVEILCPLVLLFISIELFSLCRSISKYLPAQKPIQVTLLLVFLLPVVVVAGTPQLFYEKKIYRKNPGLVEKLEELGQAVNREPVFTLFPSYAYSVNGDFRTLPNDSLDKIAIYADRTGVNWLLVTKIPSEEEVTKLWDHAYPWLNSGQLAERYGDLVEYHSGFYDEMSNTDWRLYRFRKRVTE